MKQEACATIDFNAEEHRMAEEQTVELEAYGDMSESSEELLSFTRTDACVSFKFKTIAEVFKRSRKQP